MRISEEFVLIWLCAFPASLKSENHEAIPDAMTTAVGCSAEWGISNAHPASACAEGTLIQEGKRCTPHCADGFAPTHYALQCWRINSSFILLPDDLECLPLRCAGTPKVSRGSVTCDISNGNIDAEAVSLGTTCEVSCDPGYKLYGPRSSSCFVSGNWPNPTWGPLGPCQPRTCGSVHMVSSFMVALSADSGLGTLGSQRPVKCMDGYRWNNPTAQNQIETLTCKAASDSSEAEAMWIGAYTCVPIYCEQPPPDIIDPLANFFCFGAGSYSRWAETDSCIIQCSAGFYSIGALVCQHDGSWGAAEGGYTRCVPRPCGIPTASGSGAVANVQDVTCGQADNESLSLVPDGGTCTVQCETDYFSTGKYACKEGAFVELPACFPLGTEFKSIHGVAGTLNVRALAWPIENEELLEQQILESAIASTLDEVTSADVTITLNQMNDAQASKVYRVGFSIRTGSEAEAELHRTRLRMPSYLDQLKMNIEVRIFGSAVTLRVLSTNFQTLYGAVVNETAEDDESSQDKIKVVDPNDALKVILGIVLIIAAIILIACLATGFSSWCKFLMGKRNSDLSFDELVCIIEARRDDKKESRDAAAAAFKAEPVTVIGHHEKPDVLTPAPGPATAAETEFTGDVKMDDIDLEAAIAEAGAAGLGIAAPTTSDESAVDDEVPAEATVKVFAHVEDGSPEGDTAGDIDHLSSREDLDADGVPTPRGIPRPVIERSRSDVKPVMERSRSDLKKVSSAGGDDATTSPKPDTPPEPAKDDEDEQPAAQSFFTPYAVEEGVEVVDV